MTKAFKTITIFSILLCSKSLWAQVEVDKIDRNYFDNKNIYQGPTEETKGLLNLSGTYEVNSNVITNSFLKGVLFKGFISDDLKDDVSKKLKTVNRLGLDVQLGLTGTHTLGDLTIIGGLGFREHLDGKFSKDLFEVLFRGNKMFGGKTAQLAPSRFNYFNYQNLYLGFSRALQNKPYMIGGGISLIKGGQIQRMDVKKADLFTEETGEYLNLNTSFHADFNQHLDSYFSASGFGTAINLTLARKFDKGILNAEIRDIGFIYWRNINAVSADTSIRYEGEEIIDVLNYNNYSYGSIEPDSLREKFGIGKTKKSFATALPVTFNVNYTYHHSDKLHFMGGVKYMAFANYLPRIYGKALFYLQEKFLLSPGIYVGGYGTYNVEVGAVKSFGDSFVVSATVIGLEYLLAPRYTQGLGGYLSLTKVF